MPGDQSHFEGADDLIMKGGRNLLAKILKGSRDKKLLELGLNQSPVYGFFEELTLTEIMAKIDWMIISGYLKVEYDYRLPLLVFTEKGWQIEKDTYTNELLLKLKEIVNTGDYAFVETLRDRDRKMIFLLLAKIRATEDRAFIPLLRAWQAVDYKKVRARIDSVIDSLAKTKPFPVIPGGKDEREN